ncbi:MAG: hypothetical protein K2X98_00925 [Alphaproteobacteria bacterium]|nr:hypothetical protein [Alphaproteobacteria bacterium]
MVKQYVLLMFGIVGAYGAEFLFFEDEGGSSSAGGRFHVDKIANISKESSPSDLPSTKHTIECLEFSGATSFNVIVKIKKPQWNDLKNAIGEATGKSVNDLFIKLGMSGNEEYVCWPDFIPDECFCESGVSTLSKNRVYYSFGDPFQAHFDLLRDKK